MLNKGADGINMVINYQKWSYFETEVNLTIVYDDVVHEFGEIMQNKDHFAVQGHSRSPIFVPIESSYTTSYQNDSSANTVH